MRHLSPKPTFQLSVPVSINLIFAPWLEKVSLYSALSVNPHRGNGIWTTYTGNFAGEGLNYALNLAIFMKQFKRNNTDVVHSDTSLRRPCSRAVRRRRRRQPNVSVVPAPFS